MNIDFIGDVHGCFDLLTTLLDSLGYRGRWKNDKPHIFHPDGRKVCFVGDLVNRGPDSVATLRLVKALVECGHFAVLGDHDWKLYRALKGNPVQKTHGLAETWEQIESRCSVEEREGFLNFLGNLPRQLTFYLDGYKPVTVCHAGIPYEYVGVKNKQVDTHCLYGEVHGRGEDGLLIRGENYLATWQDKDHLLIHGHTVVETVTVHGNVINIDTGACFGGKLAALRWPELTWTTAQKDT